MSVIMNGKEVSAAKRAQIAKRCEEYKKEHGGRAPGLAVIIVGDDPASAVYVRNKKKGCEEVGFNSWV
ncbi:MAG: bifunctional methylenetetrahydrofolate dehydrogenase/methenyltetrahydrofolate cyclohydrolase, partial [Clostridia bacterium]|nr:bifunctional methylenetetrahydrofolate dehydrogenase/methenyltetrahydrofolate cyclohydrolase [Clostridia bacterium]